MKIKITNDENKDNSNIVIEPLLTINHVREMPINQQLETGHDYIIGFKMTVESTEIKDNFDGTVSAIYRGRPTDNNIVIHETD